MKAGALTLGAAAMVAAALIACQNVQADGPAEDTSYRLRPGYVIDSVRPIEQELASFRQNLGDAPTALTGGGESLDALVSQFAAAVTHRDTSALRRMQVSAAEYAWLIYPSSPLTKPPYRQAPQIAWMLLGQTSDVGFNRLVDRRGGSPLRVVNYQCDPTPVVEGENKFWRGCTVTTGIGADTTREKLFGMVVERHGHFKFMSYQNQY